MTFAGVLGPTPFSFSDQSDVWIQAYCDLIGYIEENGRLNNVAAGPKIWHKSPDPTQRSGWDLGTKLNHALCSGTISCCAQLLLQL